MEGEPGGLEVAIDVSEGWMDGLCCECKLTRNWEAVGNSHISPSILCCSVAGGVNL